MHMANQLAETMTQNLCKDFWGTIKKIKNNVKSRSRMVDNETDDTGIANLFADKYQKLYNPVPYDAQEMHNLRDEINGQIKSKTSRNDGFSSLDVRPPLKQEDCDSPVLSWPLHLLPENQSNITYI